MSAKDRASRAAEAHERRLARIDAAYEAIGLARLGVTAPAHLPQFDSEDLWSEDEAIMRAAELAQDEHDTAQDLRYELNRLWEQVREVQKTARRLAQQARARHQRVLEGEQA